MEAFGIQALASRADDRVSLAAHHRAAVSPKRRFENLLDKHGTRLRRLAFAMLADAHAAEDALQEAYIRAYRGLPSAFDSEMQEAAWLYRIVQRCCFNELRSRRRRREVGDVPEIVSAPEPDRRAPIVVEALGDLVPEARIIVLLVDMLGLRYDDAAAVLGLPRGTVASRLSMARTELRSALLRRGVGPDG